MSIARRGWFSVTWAVARRPSLWKTALVQVKLLTPRRWWRRRPPRPGPADEYLELRMTTQYGRADAVPSSRDVVNYLRWCKEMRSERR